MEERITAELTEGKTAEREYEMTPGWEQYYALLDPKERKKELEYLLDETPDDGAKEFRRKLYSKRYTDPKHPDRQIDLFLFHMVFLPGVYKKRKFFMTNPKKELKNVMKELYLSEFRPLTERETNALYWEIRNAAARYYSTCDSARYGQKMFGMKPAEKDEKRKKVCEETWAVARGLLIHTKMEEELKVFSDALRDAYYAYDLEGRSWFADYEAKHYQEAVKK